VTAVYNWYTNEANTTWYKEEKVEDVTKLPFNTEERVIENKPIKRRRKPNK
jgi:phenylacetate-coenzyme A ligase PaaK-like adenylate-forming protein